nr:lethal(3)malignant brain tumor-like protein 4 [Nerophis lumbriciformis]
MKNKTSSSPVSGRRRLWSWQHYLKQQNAQAAPLEIFTQFQGFPTKKSAFKVGMKLEGIDPLHPSMFCVMTVAEVIGCRLRVHFDGYPECYDFWVNFDSADIRPAGWCRRVERRLHPPKGYSESDFDWSSYLRSTGAQAAPPEIFPCRAAVSKPTSSCDFQVGMKLEAVDQKNPSLVCVASVADVADDRVLVHFDNWDNSYDYWCDSASPLIRPVGWCEEHGRPLTAPHGHPDPENFTWEEYLRDSGFKAAPRAAFTTRAPHGFRIDQRLEAVDKRNPVLIRVATITAIEEHRVKVHYDGWSHHFDAWCDADLADLHPAGWCQRTGHPLEAPPDWSASPSHSQGACPTLGCRGVGHIKGAKYNGHHSAFGCPYSEMNMRKEPLLPDRLGGAVAHQAGDRSEGRESGEVTAESGDSPLAKRRRTSDRKSKFPQVKQEEAELNIPARGPEFLHQSVFLSSAPTARDPSLCWEQHRKLLPGVTRVRAGAVRRWSVRQVCAFVESLPGCEDSAKQFDDEQIDGKAFLLLTQRDIVSIMSIKLGPALKIYNSILMFKHEECDQDQENPSRGADRNPSPENSTRDEDESRSSYEDEKLVGDLTESRAGQEDLDRNCDINKNRSDRHHREDETDKNRDGNQLLNRKRSDDDQKREIDRNQSDNEKKPDLIKKQPPEDEKQLYHKDIDSKPEIDMNRSNEMETPSRDLNTSQTRDDNNRPSSDVHRKRVADENRGTDEDEETLGDGDKNQGNGPSREDENRKADSGDANQKQSGEDVDAR